MSDLISRQETIEHLKKWFHSKGWMVSDEDCKSILWDIPSTDEWIPCSERLPEINQKVIASTKRTCFTQVFKGTMHNNVSEWHWENNTIKTVTAWMPSPKPYKKSVD